MDEMMEKLAAVVAPLNSLLEDPAIDEIMFDSHQRVLVERNGRLEEAQSPFAKREDLERMIIALFALFKVDLGPHNPIGELRFPDHSRCTAVLSPAASDGGPYLVLRKIVGAAVTWEDLISKYRSVNAEAKALIERAIAARVNMLIGGGTGSGKTTFARLITELIPADERIIIAESIYELDAQHPRAIHLEAGGPANLSFNDILKTATHMRPDRLIVGNLEGPESFSALQYFSNGYDGSIAHTHSNSVEDALTRLENMCLMANMGLGLTEIRGLVASGIQLVIQVERLPNGDRRIMEITEVRGVENHHYVLQPLMRYNPETDTLDGTGIAPGFG